MLFILLGALLLSGRTPRAEAATLGWQPQHTWVFIVGLVKFEHEDIFDSFPTAKRRDARLAQFFRGRGVPASHLVYLQDQHATQQAIQQSLPLLLRSTAPGDTLFLYYEGHGYRSEDENKSDGFFAAYDTAGEETSGWSANSIVTTIDHYFRGDQAFLTADCCYSGYLTKLVKKHQGRISYACVASSSAREQSTGNWTFTDCLLDALRGAPYVDLNSDGAVTVAEFAAYAHDEMAIAEEQHSTFATSGDFAPDTVLANADSRPKAPIGQRVLVKYGDDWLAGRIIAVQPGQLQVQCIGYDDPADWFDTNDATQLRWLKSAKTFPLGTAVEVEWQGKWYPATVLKVEGGVHFIHYQDYDASWDEWVAAKRIRAKP